MGKEAPATPDYRGAAIASGESSKEVTRDQTYANRPDQINPWGSTTWSNEQVRDPSTGKMVTKWNQNQTLNPNSQAALDSQLDLMRGKSDLAAGMMGNVADEMGQQMDWGQFGDMATGVNAEAIDMGDLPGGVSSVDAPRLQGILDYSGASAVGGNDQYRQQAEDAIYNKATSRMDDRFAGEQKAMEIKLANQGLRPGDEAYDAEMKSLSEGRNDAYGQASMDAIIGGGAEAYRNFGMDSTRRKMETGEINNRGNFANQAAGSQFDMNRGSGNFANDARVQALREQTSIKDRAYQQGNEGADRANDLRNAAIKEEINRRNQSLNETNALLTGQQVQNPEMANVSQASRANSVDYMGAMRNTYDADLNAANARNAGIQGMMNLGTSAAGMMAGSDRRLKKNIERLGEFMGYPFYKFKYLWENTWSYGVMADEIDPSLVVKTPDGYSMVKYGELIFGKYRSIS